LHYSVCGRNSANLLLGRKSLRQIHQNYEFGCYKQHEHERRFSFLWVPACLESLPTFYPTRKWTTSASSLTLPLAEKESRFRHLDTGRYWTSLQSLHARVFPTLSQSCSSMTRARARLLGICRMGWSVLRYRHIALIEHTICHSDIYSSPSPSTGSHAHVPYLQNIHQVGNILPLQNRPRPGSQTWLAPQPRLSIAPTRFTKKPLRRVHKIVLTYL